MMKSIQGYKEIHVSVKKACSKAFQDGKSHRTITANSHSGLQSGVAPAFYSSINS